MVRRSVCSLLVLTAVSACGMQPQPQVQAGQEGGYIASYHHSDVQIYSAFNQPGRRETLNQLAIQYVNATNGQDPAKLPRAVDNCYAFAVMALDRQDSVQKCMILDYTGYKEILAGTHRPTHAESQFFGRELAGARWAHYGPTAGFTDPDRMFDYLRLAYAYVRDEANLIRNYDHPKFATR